MSADKERLRRSTWQQSAFVIMGDIMGTGVLGLPHACARLGWVLGVGSCIFFAATAVYAGSLLSRVRNDFHPDASSYSDVAEAQVGPRFGLFTRSCITATWTLQLAYYITSAHSALRTSFEFSPICYWQWSLIACAAIIGPLQLRSYHVISYATMGSTLAIVVAAVLCLSALITSPAELDAQQSLWPPPDVTNATLPDGEGTTAQSFLELYSSFGTFIFAYQGQSLFFEIMREMKEPRTFDRSVYFSNLCMVVVYTTSSVVGYVSRGGAVAGFLPQSLPPGPLKVIVGLLLFFHIVVSYVVTGQPLHRALVEATGGRAAEATGALSDTLLEEGSRVAGAADVPRPSSADARYAARWLAVTSAVLAFSFLVANAVPFFADFQNLLGALTGAPIVFGWPALFYLRGCHLHGKRVAWLDRVGCAVFLLVFLPAFTILGTVNAVQDIAEDWTGYGLPFDCCPGMSN